MSKYLGLQIIGKRLIFVFILKQVLCQYLLSIHGDVHGRILAKPAKELVKNAQGLAKQFVLKGAIKHCEIMSLDLLNNGLTALANMGALFKDKRYSISDFWFIWFTSQGAYIITRLASLLASSSSLSVDRPPSHRVRDRNFIFGINMHLCPWIFCDSDLMAVILVVFLICYPAHKDNHERLNIAHTYVHKRE